MPNECDDARLATPTGSHLTRRTGRNLRRWWLCVSVAIAATLVTSTLTVATAHAATTQITPLCRAGYICLFDPDGTIVSIPQGHSQSFPSGFPVDTIANNTTITYCLLVGEGNTRLFSAIAAETIQVVSENVYDVFPGPVCPG